MLYAEFINSEGNRDCAIWENLNYDRWVKLVKSWGDEWLSHFENVIDFSLHGTEYRSLQNQLRCVAIEWQSAEKPMISYGELSIVESWFNRMGKRYGLNHEFKENAIC